MNMALLLGVAAVISAPAIKDPPNGPSGIIGEWELQSLTIGGKEMEPPAPPLRYKFTAEGKWVMCCGSHELAGQNRTYEVNDKPTQAWIELTADARTPDRRSKGIFQIEGDTLTLCTA